MKQLALIAAILLLSPLPTLAGTCDMNTTQAVADVVNQSLSGLKESPELCISGNKTLNASDVLAKLPGVEQITFNCAPDSQVCSLTEGSLIVYGDRIYSRTTTNFRLEAYPSFNYITGEGSCSLQVTDPNSYCDMNATQELIDILNSTEPGNVTISPELCISYDNSLLAYDLLKHLPGFDGISFRCGKDTKLCSTNGPFSLDSNGVYPSTSSKFMVEVFVDEGPMGGKLAIITLMDAKAKQYPASECRGDLDGDSVISNADLDILSAYLNGSLLVDNATIQRCGDYTGDGSVDRDDLECMNLLLIGDMNNYDLLGCPALNPGDTDEYCYFRYDGNNYWTMGSLADVWYQQNAPKDYGDLKAAFSQDGDLWIIDSKSYYVYDLDKPPEEGWVMSGELSELLKDDSNPPIDPSDIKAAFTLGGKPYIIDSRFYYRYDGNNTWTMGALQDVSNAENAPKDYADIRAASLVNDLVWVLDSENYYIYDQNRSQGERWIDSGNLSSLWENVTNAPTDYKSIKLASTLGDKPHIIAKCLDSNKPRPCIDTDNGFNITQKGYASGVMYTGKFKGDAEDYCFNGTHENNVSSCSGDGCMLAEWYCTKLPDVEGETLFADYNTKCPQGCEEGVCSEPSVCGDGLCSLDETCVSCEADCTACPYGVVGTHDDTVCGFQELKKVLGAVTEEGLCLKDGNLDIGEPSNPMRTKVDEWIFSNPDLFHTMMDWPQEYYVSPLYTMSPFEHAAFEYTTKISEVQSKKGTTNIYRGVKAYIHNTQVEGTVPLYKVRANYQWKGYSHSMYSIQDKLVAGDEKLQEVLSKQGRELIDSDSGLLGYVYPNQVEGTVPLYELEHRLYVDTGHSTFDYRFFLYLADESEKSYYLNENPPYWEDNGIVGYVYPANQQYDQAVREIYKQVIDETFYDGYRYWMSPCPGISDTGVTLTFIWDSAGETGSAETPAHELLTGSEGNCVDWSGALVSVMRTMNVPSDRVFMACYNGKYGVVGHCIAVYISDSGEPWIMDSTCGNGIVSDISEFKGCKCTGGKGYWANDMGHGWGMNGISC